MSGHYRKFLSKITFVCGLVFLTVGGAYGDEDSGTFFIDSARSEYGYASSPWFDTPCNSFCKFELSGSFDGERGRDSLTLRNPNLSLSGHESTSELQAIANQKFPKSVGIVPVDPSEMFATGSWSTEASAVFREDGMRLVAAHEGRFVDGDAYWFSLVAFAATELDCDGNDVVDFSDVPCLSDSEKVSTVLDVSDIKSGDTDGDGTVGFGDFLVVSQNFGEDGGYLDGDLDLSGSVGFGDFLLVSSNFESVSGEIAGVPEPDSSLLLIAGIVLLLHQIRSADIPVRHRSV